MFDSLQDQILEREMLKILKQLQGNSSEDVHDHDNTSQKEYGQEVKTQNGDKDKQINVKQQKEEVKKVSTAVGDEMIDWEMNYISLMKECGYDLPFEENNDVGSDDECGQKLNLLVKKNEEDHNKDFAQYKLEHKERGEVEEEDDDEDEEDQDNKKSKKLMDDLDNEEEVVMTLEQQKEYFKQLRSKYINTHQNEEKKEIKSVDTTAYATNDSEVTTTNNVPTALPESKKDTEETVKQDNQQVDNKSQIKQEEAESDKPRSLLPSNHQTLTREMYDEWKKQQKVLKKAYKSAAELGITYQGEANFEGIEDSSEEEYDEKEKQEQEENQNVEHQPIEEQDEEEFDENNDLTTQDEQVETLTEVSKEYLRTNKWDCKEYKIIYSNNDSYEGEIDDKTSLKDGWGVYLYANGEKYEGFFQDDIIHGYGRYWFLGGHKYEGDWSQGMKHGVGQLEFTTGDKYVGFFENDNFHGEGEYFYKNGDKFTGTFIHGKKNGPGKFLGINGRKIIGEWIDDQLQHF